MAKNIMQLYFDNGKKVPFVVARVSWRGHYGILVTGVQLKPYQASGGKRIWYGSAYGFSLPQADGSVNDYWGVPGSPSSISCAGSYQWRIVPSAEWLPSWRDFIANYVA